MKIVLIGSNGQLGSDLCIALKNRELVPLTDKDIDITDIDSVLAICKRHKPDVIINTAAYVLVDDCEENVDIAFHVNALGARNVAVAAQQIGSVMVHLSTDYVFGGDENRNVPYTEFDTPIPLSTYGKSKLAGERFVEHLCPRYFIIRTSALFGKAGSSGKGGNFIETIIKLGKKQDKLNVVSDQVFSPTYAKDLAHKIGELIDTRYYGIFHVTNSGVCSWFEFSREILKLTRSKIGVVPIQTSGYPQKARRPAYSVLDNYHLRLLGMDDMRDWKKALTDYLVEKGHITKPKTRAAGLAGID
jgi:dTDP-4-dehydrorhamnose reductase